MPTETLRPDGDGAVSSYPWSITPSTPSTHYDKVDDETSDENSTYLSTLESLAVRVDRFTKPASQIPSEATVDSVRVYGRSRREYVANPVNCLFFVGIRVGGTDYYSGAFNPLDAYADYSYAWMVNPSTGNPWTKSDVDALELVVKGVSGRIYKLGLYYYTLCLCTQVWMEIIYTSAAGAKKRMLMKVGR